MISLYIFLQQISFNAVLESNELGSNSVSAFWNQSPLKTFNSTLFTHKSFDCRQILLLTKAAENLTISVDTGRFSRLKTIPISDTNIYYTVCLHPYVAKAWLWWLLVLQLYGIIKYIVVSAECVFLSQTESFSVSQSSGNGTSALQVMHRCITVKGKVLFLDFVQYFCWLIFYPNGYCIPIYVAELWRK